MDDSVTMNFQFQTQQIYCVRDRNGAITEGGKVNAVFSNGLYFDCYMYNVQKAMPFESGYLLFT